MSPDWLGSPQHLVAGVVVGFFAGRLAWRWTARPLLVLALAIGATAAAEIAVEVAEYPVLYGDEADAQAYYDTIADLAVTVVGGVVGAVAAVVTGRSRRGTEAT